MRSFVPWKRARSSGRARTAEKRNTWSLMPIMCRESVAPTISPGATTVPGNTSRTVLPMS